MRTALGIIALLIIILILGALYFRRHGQFVPASAPDPEPAVSSMSTPQPSSEHLAQEKEIAVLMEKIKVADALHRQLTHEQKNTLPLFDREGNLSPCEVAARRQQHAQEQLARKQAIAAASSELHQLNLQLKRKRRELRRL